MDSYSMRTYIYNKSLRWYDKVGLRNLAPVNRGKGNHLHFKKIGMHILVKCF